MEKTIKHTRNELRRRQNTLKTSGEDVPCHQNWALFFQWLVFLFWLCLIVKRQKSTYVEPPWKLHSKRVEKIWNHTRNEWRSCKIILETSVMKFHFSNLFFSRFSVSLGEATYKFFDFSTFSKNFWSFTTYFFLFSQFLELWIFCWTSASRRASSRPLRSSSRWSFDLYEFSTRLECSFISFPLVSSVFFPSLSCHAKCEFLRGFDLLRFFNFQFISIDLLLASGNQTEKPHSFRV